MGNKSTKASELPVSPRSKVSRRRNASKVYGPTAQIDKRIADVLKLKLQERESENRKPMPFNRIVMKFPSCARAFASVRKAFDDFDKGNTGTINHAELRVAMKRLGAHLTDEEVNDIFQTSDLYATNELSFKEFLVCLAIGYVLNLIPQFETAEQMLNRLAGTEKTGAEKAARAARKAEKSEALREKKWENEKKFDDAEDDALPLPIMRPAIHSEEDDPATCDRPSSILKPSTYRPTGLSINTRFPSDDCNESPAYDPSLPPLSPTNLRVASLRRTGSLHRRSASGLFGVGQDLCEAFKLSLEAWIHFDVKAVGVINKGDIREAMRLASRRSSPSKRFQRKKKIGGSSGSNLYDSPSEVNAISSGDMVSFLTDERFGELNWNHDGTLSYREFLYAFEGWVGLDEDEEADYSDEDNGDE